MSRVGHRTTGSFALARSGRPPRDTTAPTSFPGEAAAHRAAAAPVLAPKYPQGSAATSGCRRIHAVTASKRLPSSSMSKTRWRSALSSSVSRSNNSVAKPVAWKARAIDWLRGLGLLHGDMSRPTGGKAVVDNHHRSTGYRHRRPISPIAPDSAHELSSLVGLHIGQLP